MSPDVTFAAQFWLWPDPAMKRDAQGRIIFVNAAFLQLYGGSVEAWTGNVLQGWPAPNPTAPGTYPVPHRFETRMPAQDGTAQEQVYDWIEQTEADGSAFALARNVTIFAQDHNQPPVVQQATEDQNTVHHLQPQEQQEVYHTDQNYEPAQAASSFEPAPEPIPAETHVLQSNEPLHQEQVTHEPVQAQAPEPSYETITQAIPAAPEQTEQVDYAPQTPAPAPSPEIAAPVIAAPTEERDFERRALPLESNSSILGNNWRDAVIAKAVGAESTEEDTQPTAPASNNSQSGETDENRPKHILLAEDNAINALLTRTLLEAEGHTVETVEDGVLAVEAMKSQSYDLIFMDMRMPNMDGLEATRKIRQLPNVPKSLPIIALTANAFDDDRNACFDSGMNDFMTKPVSAEELSDMVKNWTGQNEATSNAA